MGSRARGLALAVCLTAAFAAASVLCATASAEWVEDNTCGYLPGAEFPLPLVEFELEEPWTPPEARFSYNSPKDKLPSSKELSASATWGDGTSSPIAVEKASSNCYVVHGPAHSYTRPGTYQFSYAIQDSSTGLGHQLHAQQMTIWNPVPQSLWTTRPHIYPTIGHPWTGVVGEFSVQSPWNASFYSAAVQTEPGFVQPATIAGTN